MQTTLHRDFMNTPNSDLPHATSRPLKQGGEQSCRVILPLLMTRWNCWAEQWWEWRGQAGIGVPGGGGQMAHKPSLGRQEAGGGWQSMWAEAPNPLHMLQCPRGLQLQITLSKRILLINLRQPKHRFYQLHSSINLALITYIITQKLSRRLKTA